MTPQLQSQIIEWRSKAVNGTLSQEDLAIALAALRGARKTAAAASPRAKVAKAKAVIPSANDLLKEMGLDDEDETEPD